MSIISRITGQSKTGPLLGEVLNNKVATLDDTAVAEAEAAQRFTVAAATASNNAQTASNQARAVRQALEILDKAGVTA